MTAQPVSSSGGRVRQVGKVSATFLVTNGADEIRAADGTISAGQIRSLTLTEVMVDTGATTLCLPIDLIRQLGLRLTRTVEAMTAAGLAQLDLYDDARITIEAPSDHSTASRFQ